MDKSADARPLSPHLQIWRWHVTMASSILHRATGLVLYAAALGLAFWLWSAAAWPEGHGVIAAMLQSPIGHVVLYGIVAALAFHWANGVRHFVFDLGWAMSPDSAETSAWIAILFALAAPVGLWALLTFGI